MAYERFDVVVVPFPFTDRAQTKRRPALVISGSAFNKQAGHGVLAMITSANNPPWPFDVDITDLAAAGLPVPSVVRMKLFTLDQRLILRKCGVLPEQDGGNVSSTLKKVFGFDL